MVEGDARRPALRASDAERERVVVILRDGAGDGRLTFEELAQRTELAYQATTGAELERLVADLPAAGARATVDATPRKRRRWNIAMLSSCERKGRWRPAPDSVALAMLGSASIDLRDAVIEGDELVVTSVAVLGNIEITVPEGVDVDVGGFALLGSNDHRQGTEPVRPGTPVVRVRAFSILGSINVSVEPGTPPRQELPAG